MLFFSFHRQRSLAGCSPWGHKESDLTERLTLSFSLFELALWAVKRPGESGFLFGGC